MEPTSQPIESVTVTSASVNKTVDQTVEWHMSGEEDVNKGIRVGRFTIVMELPFFYDMKMVETYCEEKGWSKMRFFYEWERLLSARKERDGDA